MDSLNEKNNFIYLTAALLVILLSMPVLETLEAGFAYWTVRVLISAMLLVTYFCLDFGRWWRLFVGVVLVLQITGTTLRTLGLVETTGLIHLVSLLFYFVAIAYSASRRVLFSNRIDTNRVMGGIAIYLLFGMIWAMLYLMVLNFEPEALNGIAYESWEANLFEVTYYSYITLSTTGYGEITPAIPITRALAYLEALTGTFYMAVVVASLVSGYVHERHEDS